MRNTEVSAFLDEIADLLELKGENKYRVNAYRQAARSVENLTEDVADLRTEGKLEQVYGIGPSISTRIGELLDSGHSPYLDELRTEVSPSVRELLKVPGLGSAKAHMIHHELGITTVAELKEAALDHRLQQLPGIRQKTEEKILREIERYEERGRRMLLGVARPAAEEIMGMLRGNPDVLEIHTGGSLRRWKETIGDIDLIVSSEHPERVTAAFAELPIVREIIGMGHTKASVLVRGNLQIDLLVVRPDQYGSALQHFTGGKAHNIALRDLAIQRGYKLNEYGLFEEATGERLAGNTEEEIYHAMGMDWMPPELRENRGELEAAARHQLPDLVSVEEIRGDLQMHTDWSDGSSTLEEMASAAIAHGLDYVAVTDHSQSLTVANGVRAERIAGRLEEIRRLNEELAPFRIVASAEVDILPDGRLDYPDEILSQLELVTIAIHSNFKQSREQMTARILAALRNPYVDILAHPTGRLLLRRDPYDVDLEQVLLGAEAAGVAVEINASPDRLDLDDVWARRAKDLGVMLCINTDAHAPSHFDFMRYGVAVARRGWIEKKDVLNALPVEKLLDWKRRRASRAAA